MPICPGHEVGVQHRGCMPEGSPEGGLRKISKEKSYIKQCLDGARHSCQSEIAGPSFSSHSCWRAIHHTCPHARTSTHARAAYQHYVSFPCKSRTSKSLCL